MTRDILPLKDTREKPQNGEFYKGLDLGSMLHPGQRISGLRKAGVGLSFFPAWRFHVCSAG